VIPRNPTLAVCLGLLLVAAVSCAKKPVLYPTPHYQAVGKQQAEAAVEECLAMASDQGVRRSAERGRGAARRTAGGAATGAVAGSVSGAIWGNAGRGAASGAAGGAAAGLFSSLFTGSGPSPAYQNYVDRCLAEQGFDVMGWQ